jgi:hypothetical protein
MAIIESGDIERIPQNCKDAFSKKGIAPERYMEQFEKEAMTAAVKNPLPFAIGFFIFAFFFFMLVLNPGFILGLFH